METGIAAVGFVLAEEGTSDGESDIELTAFTGPERFSGSVDERMGSLRRDERAVWVGEGPGWMLHAACRGGTVDRRV